MITEETMAFPGYQACYLSPRCLIAIQLPDNIRADKKLTRCYCWTHKLSMSFSNFHLLKRLTNVISDLKNANSWEIMKLAKPQQRSPDSGIPKYYAFYYR
ncbi:MAG: hypothetical protein ACLSEU_07120 [Streptococcus salivarius]